MNQDKLRILLVDDDEDDYIMTRDLLAEIKNRTIDLEWVPTYDAAVMSLSRNDHDGHVHRHG